MRILFIGTKPKPDNMEFHVIQSLNEMGHTVLEFDVQTIVGASTKVDRYAQYIARTLLREPERIHENKLINYAKKTAPDLVLVLLGNIISPKTISLLKKHIAAPIVCWCQDSLATIGRQYMIGAPYDLVFLKDRYLVDDFNNMLSGRFRFLAEACNPSMHYYEQAPEEKLQHYACDVSTAGTLHYYRQEILDHLSDKFHLKVSGNRPDWLDYRLGVAHTDSYVVDREKRYTFSSAKIVLNTLHYAEIRSVNCRFFEVAGCGGFQLVSKKAEIGEFLELGTEVETFENKDDLIEKIRFYLNEPEKRSLIAKNGMRKAHTEHTYKHRLSQLLDDVSHL